MEGDELALDEDDGDGPVERRVVGSEQAEQAVDLGRAELEYELGALLVLLADEATRGAQQHVVQRLDELLDVALNALLQLGGVVDEQRLDVSERARQRDGQRPGAELEQHVLEVGELVLDLAEGRVAVGEQERARISVGGGRVGQLTRANELLASCQQTLLALVVDARHLGDEDVDDVNDERAAVVVG